jgi:FAD/FMN-containing dehydrogenase
MAAISPAQASWAGWLVERRHCRTSCLVNDVHARLNHTAVARIVKPRTVSELADVVGRAASERTPLSFCGGRHAMGGQQFRTAATLVDTTALDRVLDLDPERGLITAQAGIAWPALINHLLWAFPREHDGWGIIQKQTGADRLTLGGALSSNIHGRGLRLRPFIGDVESFEIVDASGTLRRCSRNENAELFALAIGGYGLFGPIARVTLRLADRRKIERRVAIARIDDVARLFDQRVREGCEYGDFQFATDPKSSGQDGDAYRRKAEADRR